MNLNTLKPAIGAKTPGKRLGRGMGSGKGKTAGKGHKGQKARAGGFHKKGFEGGQMPLQRRIPKSGFRSAKARATEEVRLSALKNLPDDIEIVDLLSLKKAGLIRKNTSFVKMIAQGEVTRSYHIKGILISEGARKAIKDKNGKIEA